MSQSDSETLASLKTLESVYSKTMADESQGILNSTNSKKTKHAYKYRTQTRTDRVPL